MKLLSTEDFRDALAEALGQAKSELIVLSAFTSSRGYRWILNRTTQKGVIGSLVVRWRLDDLLSGASDLDVYPLAKSVGWNVYIYPDLHAKSILIDSSHAFVGSANMTAHGLSIINDSNHELGVEFIPTQQNIGVFDSILSESILVTDKIYNKMKLFLDDQPPHDKDLTINTWPNSIKSFLEKTPGQLRVDELPWTTPEHLLKFNPLKKEKTRSADHDFNLLGLEMSDFKNSEVLKGLFMQTKAWRWLLNKICEGGNQESYFGTITVALHDSLLDDPKPYRTSVKKLVQNLFLWAEFLGVELIVIDMPNKKSQRIRYTGS